MPLLGVSTLAFSLSHTSNDGDLLSVIQAIGILAVVVAVHEGGHFLAARLQNIHVDKFALGFGPPIVRYEGEVVEYSIRAIPLGGFVAFPDDDPYNDYEDDDPNLLKNRPIKDRALVVSAGVIANVIFAFVILMAQASTVGIQGEVLEPGVVIPKVFKESAAERAGLRAGDVVLSVDDLQVAPDPKSVEYVIDAIESHPNQEMTFRIDRSGKEFSLHVTPITTSNGLGKLGIALNPNERRIAHVARNAVESVQLASHAFVELTKQLLMGLQQLVLNFSKSADQVSGPVAVVAMGAKIAQLDASQLFMFAAAINLNLAVVNTLPLPALDGGYFALLILETVRGGKKLPKGVEKGVMASGILFLTAVGFFLVVRDVENLL